MPRMRDLRARLQRGIATPVGAPPPVSDPVASLLENQLALEEGQLKQAQLGMMQRKLQIDAEEAEARLEKIRADRERIRMEMARGLQQSNGHSQENGLLGQLVPRLLESVDRARQDQIRTLLDRQAQPAATVTPPTPSLQDRLQEIKGIMEFAQSIQPQAPSNGGSLPPEIAVQMQRDKYNFETHMKQLEASLDDRHMQAQLAMEEWKQKNAWQTAGLDQLKAMLPAVLGMIQQRFIGGGENGAAPALPMTTVPADSQGNPAAQPEGPTVPARLGRCPWCQAPAAVPDDIIGSLGKSCGNCGGKVAIATPLPNGQGACPQCRAPLEHSKICPNCNIAVVVPAPANVVLGPNGLPVAPPVPPPAAANGHQDQPANGVAPSEKKLRRMQPPAF